MNRLLKTITLVLCGGLLSACGTHWVGIPPASLSRLRVSSIQPDGYFTTVLKRQLQERGVKISNNAPLRLAIESVYYTNKTPDPINAGTAYTSTPTLRVSYSLSTKKGTIILPTTWINVHDSLLHNANQINLSSMNEIYYRLLSTRLSTALYYRLSTSHVQSLIRKKAKEA